MAVVYSKVLLFDPPLIYTAPDICVFGAVSGTNNKMNLSGSKLIYTDPWVVFYTEVVDRGVKTAQGSV